jgi:tetratricopeptide (TPR) repeat protein
VDRALKQKLSPTVLDEIQRECAARVDAGPLKLLQAGSGWGALEARRRAAQAQAAFPAGLVFPDSTLQAEEQRWLTLMETGRLPEPEPEGTPAAWMIQHEWRELLERSLKIDTNQHWYAWLHLGVMKAEAFDDEGAVAAWEESIRCRPSAWAWRNLGAMAIRRRAPEEALAPYQKAWELAVASGAPDISFAIEYLSALHAASHFDAAWTLYKRLPSGMQSDGVVRLLAAKVAFARDDLAFVESALAGEFASIREGARDLTDLWFGLQAKRAAACRGQPCDEALLRELKKTFVPPLSLDFRLVE